MADLKTHISGLFSPWQAGLCPGGQVRVVKDGHVVFDEAFGYADLERRVLNAPDTVFHVASVSKQITCACALMLWEEGKLDIEAAIRRYIPDLIAFDEPVTVLNIMHNVSGIRDQWDLQMLAGVRMDDVITQRDLLALNARQRSLNFPPETEYYYSNTNFVFLAEIINRISGENLAEFAQRRIFAPLGMNDTFIRHTYTDLVKNRALSYECVGSGFKWIPLNFSNWGATSLHTTARDFTKWLSHYMAPTLFSADTLARMLEVPTLKDGAKTVYACGVNHDSYKGHRRITHDGADAGYRASACCFPDDRLTVMITANVPNLILSEQVQKIADIVLDLPEVSAENALYQEAIEKPALGNYYSPSFMALVDIEADRAIIEGVPHKLIHAGGNCYGFEDMASRIYFKDGTPWMNPAAPSALMPYSAATFNAEEQAQLEGQYYSDELQTLYTLKKDGDGLVLFHWRSGRGRLVSLPDGSYVAPLDIHLKIALDKERKALTILGNRVRAITLEKVKIVK